MAATINTYINKYSFALHLKTDFHKTAENMQSVVRRKNVTTFLCFFNFFGLFDRNNMECEVGMEVGGGGGGGRGWWGESEPARFKFNTFGSFCNFFFNVC